MSDLNFDQAADILAIWDGRTVKVQVYGTAPEQGRILAMLNGKLSEQLGDDPDWRTYAVGDPTDRVVFTLYEPDFQRAEVQDDGDLILYSVGGSIAIGLAETAPDSPES
jgi:hypothetical protein